MTELGVAYPATTMPPAASCPGRVIHSLYDVSAYAGTPEQRRYISAEDEADRLEALRRMPDATVPFYELDEGEPFYDIPPLYKGDFKRKQ